MKKFRSLILIVLSILSFTLVKSQEDCFEIDTSTFLAYKVLNDNILFNGSCEKSFKNGQLACRTDFIDGHPISGKSWYKNGQLYDSTVYLDGFKKFEEYIFNKKGLLIAYSILETRKIEDATDPLLIKIAQKDKNTDIKLFNHEISSIYRQYYRNGVVKYERISNDKSERYFIKEYDKGGNIINSGYFIDKRLIGHRLFTSIRDGIYTEYDVEGNKAIELNYINGEYKNPATKFTKEGRAYQVELELDESGDPKYKVDRRKKRNK